MDALVGKWMVTNRENIEALMEALGMSPEVCAKMTQSMDAEKTVVEYCRNGDTWTFKVDMEEYKVEKSYKLGEEFEFVGMDGSPVKSLINWQGDKFVEKHISLSEGYTEHYTRKIDGDTMTTIMEINGVKAKETMKRV